MEIVQFFVAMKFFPILNPNETLHRGCHRGVREENRHGCIHDGKMG
jgi:hypothetical protein